MICHRKLTKWLCNGLLLITALILMSLCLLNILNPHLPSIRCQGNTVTDINILHAFTGDTVTLGFLLLVTFLVPLIQIFGTEFLLSHSVHNSFSNPMETSPWRRGATSASRWFRDYIYGVIFIVLLNDLCKTILNSPRPHFVDSCKPNFTDTDCKNGWVSEYTCSNDDISTWRLADSRKSFPSGHAAIGMFSAIFMILYQHSRLTVKRHGAIVVLWCHFSWLAWGLFCALSRVVDFRHHGIDIIVGGIIGIIGALFTAHYVCRNFETNEYNIDYYEKQRNYQHQSRNVNGTATVIEGFISNSSLPPPSSESVMHQSISMPMDLNGSIPGTKSNTPSNGRILTNSPQRPSLRRLLSSQSTLTQMSEIAEDQELERI